MKCAKITLVKQKPSGPENTCANNFITSQIKQGFSLKLGFFFNTKEVLLNYFPQDIDIQKNTKEKGKNLFGTMKEKEKEKGVYLRHVLAASAPFVGINDVIIATFVELVYQAEYLLPQLIERMDDIRSPLGRPMWCVVCFCFTTGGLFTTGCSPSYIQEIKKLSLHPRDQERKEVNLIS